tara:strand:+ start:1784 stop:2131 length:348 start_codon:yes stop_codon:yes gene_type:complete
MNTITQAFNDLCDKIQFPEEWDYDEIMVYIITYAFNNADGINAEFESKTTTHAKETLDRLKQIQANDLNIVTCGDCGLVHIVDFENELIECSKCGFTGEHGDYPDFVTEGDLLGD